MSRPVRLSRRGAQPGRGRAGHSTTVSRGRPRCRQPRPGPSCPPGPAKTTLRIARNHSVLRRWRWGCRPGADLHAVLDREVTLTYPLAGSRTYSGTAAMLAKLLSSATTSAPGASRGSSRRSTGRHRSFQPSSSTSPIGPGRPASVCRASPARIVTAPADARPRSQVRPGRRTFAAAQLGGDDAAGAVVGHRGGQIDGRDAERGAELHDGVRPAGPDQRVEQLSGLGGDRHVDVLARRRPVPGPTPVAHGPGRRQAGRDVAVLGGGGEQPAERGRRAGVKARVLVMPRTLDATLRLDKAAGILARHDGPRPGPATTATGTGAARKPGWPSWRRPTTCWSSAGSPA